MLQHDNYAINIYMPWSNTIIMLFNTYRPCSNTIIMLLTLYAMLQHDNYAF